MKQSSRHRGPRGIPLGILPLVLLLAAGCSDRSTAPTPALAVSIEVDQPLLVFESIGDEHSLAARVVDATGQPVGGMTVHWTLEEEGVVQQLDATTFRAVSPGTRRVVGQIEGGPGGTGHVTVTANLIVRPVPVGIAVTGNTDPDVDGTPVIRLLSLGQELRVPVHGVDARGNPLAHAGTKMTWRLEDPSSARIDAEGMLRATGEGSTLLVVENGDQTAFARVVVEPRLAFEICAEYHHGNATHALSCSPVDLLFTERPTDEG